MMGLLYLLVFGIYLVVSLAAVIIAVSRAKRHGRNPWLWGFIAAFIMYNLVFWDWLPTKFLHKYYCATKAGFWVYKTPEQWKAENPGVAERLTWQENCPKYESPNISWGAKLNDRFVWTHQISKTLILPVTLDTESIVDVKTGAPVIKRISVGSGYSYNEGFGTLKIWVGSEPCIPNIKEFGFYKRAYWMMGREIK